MLNLISQPAKDCVIAKNSCKEICFLDPTLVDNQGTFPFVVAGWFQGDIGATGVFLDEDIEIGTTNGAGVFDGTIQGFQQMISICFPDLIGVQYGVIQDTVLKLISIQFPTIEAYDNFAFAFDNVTFGQIGFTSTNGVAAILRDCYFDIRIYDENDNLICQLDPQYPSFTDTTPVLVEENCISSWNVGLSTNFPPPLDVISIDENFCKNIRYRIWLKCASDSTCGFKAEQLIESDLLSVVNSVHDKDYDFEQHCVLDRFLDGTLAKFITQRPKVTICEGVDAWLWICPNLRILDDIGASYNYGVRFTGYDSSGSIIGTADSLVGSSNEAFVIPTGFNYLDALPVPPPSTLSYYTVEFIVLTDGDVFVLTQPVTYMVVKCCCKTALYFKEQLGSFTHICFDECQKKIIDAEGQTVCIGDKCNKEILTIGNKASLTYELKTKVSDDNLRKLFIKSTDFWIKEDGEYKRVSIEKRKVKLIDKEGGRYTIEVVIKFLDCEMND